jgi:hypothetical protein
LVVLGANPTDTVLHDAYDEIVAEWVVPDPQTVPAEILGRGGVLDPEGFLVSGIIGELSSHRGIGLRGRRGPDLVGIRAQVKGLGSR